MGINMNASKSELLASLLEEFGVTDGRIELVPPCVLSKEIDTTEGTLAVWRCTKRENIPYLKIGSKVRYIRPGIEKWKLSKLHGMGGES